MEISTAKEEKQGFVYQGKFSASLDFESLHDKINQHLSSVRAQKNESENLKENTQKEQNVPNFERN